MIIFLAEKDPTAARGKLYAEMVRRSAWGGEMEVVEFEGESHCFQITDNEIENAKILINRFVAFLSRWEYQMEYVISSDFCLFSNFSNNKK